MIEYIELTMSGVGQLAELPVWNHTLVERACVTARRRGVTLLAFGLAGDRLRMLVQGDPAARANHLRGVKVGTIGAARARRHRLVFVETDRRPVRSDLETAVVEVHRVAALDGARSPLDSPWTSHRDMLGYRRAPYFDAGPLRALVDPLRVHRRLGGAPTGPRRDRRPSPPSLGVLLHAAAAVRGTLAPDPSCYRAFVQAAKARGYPAREIARSLSLTVRRVNQLAYPPDPYLPLVDKAVADPRLRAG